MPHSARVPLHHAHRFTMSRFTTPVNRSRRRLEGQQKSPITRSAANQAPPRNPQCHKLQSIFKKMGTKSKTFGLRLPLVHVRRALRSAGHTVVDSAAGAGVADLLHLEVPPHCMLWVKGCVNEDGSMWVKGWSM